MIDYKINLKKVSINYSNYIYNIVNTNRIYLSNYLNWINLTKTEEDTKNFLKKKIIEHKNDISKTFIIFFNNVCVGIIGFNSINYKKKKFILGIGYPPKYECAIHNIKSNSTALRTGFKKIEYLKSAEKINNIYYDQNLYLKIIKQ